VTTSAAELIEQVRRTPAAEWLAVVLGVVYIILIMRRQRWGWAAGGCSSLILMVLAARSHLPMQAMLQFSYVVAAVYGWWKWAPDAAWPLIDSLVACLGLLATWLVAKVYLENWLYWMLIDALSLYLFSAQGLVVTSLLFAIYFVISTVGLVSWRRTWRAGAVLP
jgi:nicotinamide mononucleotide transporter